MVRAFEPRFLPGLTRMYLSFTPRGSIDGLPPLDDRQCSAWVTRITTGSASLISLFFDGRIIGHAVLLPMRKNMCEVFLVIAPSFQKSGIGTHMMHAIIQLGFEMGYAKIWLSVDKTNFPALHLYYRCGFEAACITDSLQMEMVLDLKRRHPTARMRVARAMSKKALAIHKDAPCRKALELFSHNRVDVLPVIGDDRTIAGSISRADLMGRMDPERPVGDIALREIVCLQKNCALDRAISLLREQHLSSIPVVDRRHHLVGSICRRDILAHFFKPDRGARLQGRKGLRDIPQKAKYFQLC